MNIRNSMTPLASNYFRSTATAARTIRETTAAPRTAAAKDPSGMAITQKMSSHMAGISAASRNVQDAVSMVQTAEGVLGQVSNITNRMAELATKAGNGTLGSQERDILLQEFNQLSAEIDRMGQSSRFNGNPLFDGSTYTMLVGENADYTMDIEFSAMSSAKLGLNNVDFSSAAQAAKSLDVIKNASNQVSSQRANLGAAENGMQSVFNQLDNSQYNLAQSLSRIMGSGKDAVNQSISGLLNDVSMAMMKNSQNLVHYNALQFLLK